MFKGIHISFTLRNNFIIELYQPFYIAEQDMYIEFCLILSIEYKRCIRRYIYIVIFKNSNIHISIHINHLLIVPLFIYFYMDPMII